MTRRADAIAELEKWYVAETAARMLEAHGILPITRDAMRTEADDYRENILMLMGVDETPAAILELGCVDEGCPHYGTPHSHPMEGPLNVSGV